MGRTIVPLAVMAGLLSGCGGGSDRPAAERAWVRLAAIPGRPAAAYLTVESGSAPAEIVAIRSPRAARAELHQSSEAGGMAAMRPVATVPVPAHGRVRFAPGGYHVMLFGVAPRVQPGGTMPLLVYFAHGKPIEAEAKVVAAGDPGPGG